MQALKESSIDKIKQLEAVMLDMPQYEAEIKHYHANGFYAREMRIPAGVVLVGKTHASEHLCFISQGKCLVVSEEFTGEVSAPYTYVSKPGAKRAITALEDLVWTTVHRTELSDLDALEAELIVSDQITLDKLDHVSFLQEAGVTEGQSRLISEHGMLDLELGLASYGLRLADSLRQGKGIFAAKQLEAHVRAAPMTDGLKRTTVGRYTNHSAQPNCRVVKADGDFYLETLDAIAKGDELVIDYRYILRSI